jgi:dihydropteroate synthase
MLQLQHLAELFESHQAEAEVSVDGFEIGGEFFDFDESPALMGVVNLSPGSWYRESVCLSPEAAIQRAFILYAEGANLIDVGAESTLPNAERVSAEDQTAQLSPIVSELHKAGVPASVETYEAQVAEAVLNAGAEVINLTGSEQGAEIYGSVAEHDAAVIICHVQGPNVRAVGDYPLAEDPIPMLGEYFTREIESATKAGVEKIFIDPGMGFYYANLQDGESRVRHQMNTLINSFRLRSLGRPICQALPHAFDFFKNEVRSAESFFATLAALGKTGLFRTHEVPRVKAVLDTLSAFDDWQK